jgi:hypothetical protein
MIITKMSKEVKRNVVNKFLGTNDFEITDFYGYSSKRNKYKLNGSFANSSDIKNAIIKITGGGIYFGILDSILRMINKRQDG